MELEDSRDDLRTRLHQAESLLDQTRRLGDRILGEHAQLAEAHRALRQEVEAFRTQEKELRALIAAERERAEGINRELEKERAHSGELDRILDATRTLASERLEQAERLQGMIADLHATRSWRYTKPLRALENMLGLGNR